MVRRTRCNVGGSTCTGYIPEGTAEDVQTHLETCHADQLNRAPKGENGRVECLLRECSTKVKMGRLGKHMEEKHLGRRRTQCDGCGKWLSRPDALKRHKKRFHKGVEATESNKHRQHGLSGPVIHNAALPSSSFLPDNTDNMKSMILSST
ncbi:uncharacterized protein B0H18DRAFT_1024069 [Fomitopsis serialis]|uniref:uncharacterized protein n=1 Tax=Fomitopsis serialis TaxID=139415 RepID=UPI002008006F|nr:uncharacterized protein B0H18DRAFT_1024069 [Neoantrodia serialis]KAH9920459.1 hypothetical protein B0H18DRAFT_1024069 [Neoantrodia serialis]